MAIVNTEELNKLEKEIRKKVEQIIELERMKDSKGLYERTHPMPIGGSIETTYKYTSQWEWEFGDSIFVGEVLNKRRAIVKRYKRDYYEEVKV